MSIGTLGTNFSEIFIKVQTFSLTKMHLKISSAKWRPFLPGGDEFIYKMICECNKTLHVHYEVQARRHYKWIQQVKNQVIAPLVEGSPWICGDIFTDPCHNLNAGLASFYYQTGFWFHQTFTKLFPQLFRDIWFTIEGIESINSISILRWCIDKGISSACGW